MKKILMNFDKPLNTLDGKTVMKSEHEPMTQAGLLLSIPGRQTKSSDPLKIYSLGQELSKTQALELDKSDSELLRQIVQKDEDTYDIFRAQLLETIQDAMNAKPEPKGE